MIDYGALFRLSPYEPRFKQSSLASTLYGIGDLYRGKSSPKEGIPAVPSVEAKPYPYAPAPASYGSSSGEGRGSWYSQYPGWIDTGDKPNSNALGVPDTEQGVALPTRAALGKTIEVTAPDGRVFVTRQTDVGPAKWTGRSIDISAALADRMGYKPGNFPTDARFKWRVVD